MLQVGFVIFLVLWLVGMATPYTMHGYIHVFLILAFATALARVFIWRRSAID
jgi:uncharacterized protein DUF5670